MASADAAAKPIRLTLADKEIKSQSPTQRVIQRFIRHRAAMFGLVLLLGVFAYILVGSIIFSEAQAITTVTLEPMSTSVLSVPSGMFSR